MKKILTLIIIMLVAFHMGMGAQENERKLSREEQKVLQTKIDSIQYVEALAAVKDTAFTLEANQVVFKYGQRAYVTSRTNFVKVENGKATVQVSFNIPVAGPNGMGGVTVEGMITRYVMKTDKKGTTYLTLDVTGAAISAQLNITMFKGRNQASVTIMPNFNSRRLTLEGIILPADKSFVVQGNTL